MKNRILTLALTALLVSSCGLTRIITTYPSYYPSHTTQTVTTTVPVQTVTTVTVPQNHTVTTITSTGTVYDLSQHLDLQAVGAAFAQSSSVQEFEYLLNNSSYMLSNLDLNRDGYVDYLRVMETFDGRAHVFVIQAVLGTNYFQDVATLVAEVSGYTRPYYVQVIGSSYIYGTNYIVQPVFVGNPPIFSYLCRPSYRPWRSPYYWSYYPSIYRRPSVIVVNHYHAYVTTYMSNHHYCNHVTYVSNCHYPNYSKVCYQDQRNDYGNKHPEHSFTVRNADKANANEIRTSGSSTTTVTNSRTAPNTSTSRTGGTSGSSAATTNSRTASTTATTSPSASRTGNTAATAAGTTTSASRTGTATSSNSRTGATAATTSSASRTNTAAATTSSASRTNTAASTSRTGSTTASTSASRTATTSSASRTASTTVSSNVKRSGTSDTRISTVSSTGAQTTTSRTSTSTSAARTSTSASRANTATSASRTSTSASRTSTSTSSRR